MKKICFKCRTPKTLDHFPPIPRSGGERGDICYGCIPQGMGSNAFGGHNRLDKLDLSGPSLVGGVLLDVVSNTQPECLLWLATIQDAVQNYLPWGLAKNGTTAPEFWHGVEFLFRVRASKPETWADAPRSIRQTYWDETPGRRVSRTVVISDSEIRSMCLDCIWDHLCFPMTLEAFCADLLAERREVVTTNWGQIVDYLRLPGTLADWEHALVAPTVPNQVAELEWYRLRHKALVLQMATNPEAQPESAQAEAA